MSAITVLNQANVPIGPFTRAQIAEKLQSGEITLTSLAFVEGLTQWTPLSNVLAKVDAVFIPPVPSATAPVHSYAATMQPPGDLVYAGFWIRVAAHIIDNLIVSVPVMVVWFICVIAAVGTGTLAPLFKDPSSQRIDPAIVASMMGTIIVLYLVLIVGRIVLVWLYHAFLESGEHQSTWGKRILGLKVTSINGQRISFAHASGRYFSTIITGMTMGIGYLMVAFTDRKQTLHDMIVSTLVVVRK